MALLDLDLVSKLDWVLLDKDANDFEPFQTLLQALLLLYDSLGRLSWLVLLDWSRAPLRAKHRFSLRNDLGDALLADVLLQDNFLW